MLFGYVLSFKLFIFLKKYRWKKLAFKAIWSRRSKKGHRPLMDEYVSSLGQQIKMCHGTIPTSSTQLQSVILKPPFHLSHASPIALLADLRHSKLDAAIMWHELLDQTSFYFVKICH